MGLAALRLGWLALVEQVGRGENETLAMGK
jgi:hypothetical protein